MQASKGYSDRPAFAWSRSEGRWMQIEYRDERWRKRIASGAKDELYFADCSLHAKESAPGSR